jgi:hypothetical protein
MGCYVTSELSASSVRALGGGEGEFRSRSGRSSIHLPLCDQPGVSTLVRDV